MATSEVTEREAITQLLSGAYGINERLGDEVWWRGQADADWSLVPKIFRKDLSGKWLYPSESILLKRFRAKAKCRHPNTPPDDSLQAWLSLAQHFRLPTRLLDWTQSLLVAAFFAVQELVDRPGQIWALKPLELNRKQSIQEDEAPDEDRPLFESSTGLELVKDAFSDERYESISINEKVARIHAVFAEETDPRMLIQASCFTIHGTATPLEMLTHRELRLRYTQAKYAEWDSSSFLGRFEIPSEHKDPLRKALRRMGITHSYLFPDLDNLAQDLSEDFSLERA